MKKIILIAIILSPILSNGQVNDFFVRNDTAFIVYNGDTSILALAVTGDLQFKEKLVNQRIFNKLSHKIKALSSPEVSTSTTPANTALNFHAQAGKQYKLELIADYQTSATTTGCIIGVATNGGGQIRGVARGAISASAANSEQSVFIRSFNGAGSTLTTTGVSAINTPHFIHITAIINCTQSGTFGIVFGSEVNGSAAQLNQNSILIIQEL